MDELAAKPDRRRLQFSLRKLLLWMVMVALGFSILSTLEPDALGWVVLPAWLIAVLILRWFFGTEQAAGLSILMGMLPFQWFLCSICVPDNWRWKDSLVACLLGGLIGFVLFLLVEAACRVVNWIDRSGQSDG